MKILLNIKANSCRAAEKWGKAGPVIMQMFPGAGIIEAGESAYEKIAEAAEEGEREFISAGGDGTMNFLVNALAMNYSCLDTGAFRIGAVGLGSSNDFHKPYTKFICGVPVRINFQNCEPADLGILKYTDDRTTLRTKYWVINSSIGVLADANKYFNHKGVFWDYLKRKFLNEAILYAGLRSIALNRSIKCRILSGGAESNTIISNLGITKNPNFAGSFRYPYAMEPACGKFGVHLIEKQNTVSLIKTLVRLSNNYDKPLLNITTGQSGFLKVTSEKLFAVEYDGEVITTKRAEFNIKKAGIFLCK